MATNEELNRLRAEARAKHRSATRKVSRLNTQNGVPISGTKLDPRRDVAALKRYNSAQLQSYMAKLDDFIDRKTQYVPDAAGRPIKGEQWKKYKILERNYNKRVNENFDKVADVKLPSGNTIATRFKLTTADKRSNRGVVVNAPYDPPVRKSQQIKSEKALKVLIKDMEKRVQSDAEMKRDRNSKTQFNQMAKVLKKATPDKKLQAALKTLTPDQFRVLWNYTSFATDVSIGYEEAKKLMENGQASFNQGRAEAHTGYAMDLIGWAKKLK